jgi:hypothetical protein
MPREKCRLAFPSLPSLLTLCQILRDGPVDHHAVLHRALQQLFHLNPVVLLLRPGRLQEDVERVAVVTCRVVSCRAVSGSVVWRSIQQVNGWAEPVACRRRRDAVTVTHPFVPTCRTAGCGGPRPSSGPRGRGSARPGAPSPRGSRPATASPGPPTVCWGQARDKAGVNRSVKPIFPPVVLRQSSGKPPSTFVASLAYLLTS